MTKVGIVLVLTDFFESSDGMGTKLIGNVGGRGRAASGCLRNLGTIVQPVGDNSTWGKTGNAAATACYLIDLLPI